MEASDSSLVTALANVLETLIDANKKCQSAPSSSLPQVMTKFQCSYAPDVSIISYLERIRKYAKCSDCCFVISLIYIDRMIEACNVVLTSLNVHRLLITSIMLSAKFLDDLFYNNAFYAKLGGVTVSELNSLEIEFLQKIHFSLYVSPESYNKYLQELRRFTGVPSIVNNNPLFISTTSIPSSSSLSSLSSSSELVNSVLSQFSSSSSSESPVSVTAVERPNVYPGTWNYDQSYHHHQNMALYSDQSSSSLSSVFPYKMGVPNHHHHHHHQQQQQMVAPPPPAAYFHQYYHHHQSNDHINTNTNNRKGYFFNSYRPLVL